MARTHKNMRAGVEKRGKGTSGIAEEAVQHAPVKVVEVEDADFAPEVFNIFQNFMGSGFPERTFVFVYAELADGVHKGIHGKGIMLGRNRKELPGRASFPVPVFQKFGLLEYLAGMGEKFGSFGRHLDSPV